MDYINYIPTKSANPFFDKLDESARFVRVDETDCAEGLVMDPITRRCGLSHEPQLYTFYVYRRLAPDGGWAKTKELWDVFLLKNQLNRHRKTWSVFCDGVCTWIEIYIDDSDGVYII